jgi:hypothetical protein
LYELKIKEIDMRTKKISILLACVLVLLSFNCKKEKKPPTVVNVAPVEKPFEGYQSVCLFDSSPVMLEPTQRANPVSVLTLGEKVLWFNEAKIDSFDGYKKYLKIRLSDGKEGWTPENNIAIDSKPAVTICKIIIYMRPDPVTITNKEFLAMEFVAVSNPEGEWCEAKGREGKKTGWIKAIYTSAKSEDITVALLASKALAEKKRDKKKEQLTAIINNPAFSRSIFIDTLKKCLANIPPWDDDDVSWDESDESDEFDELDEELQNLEEIE